MSTNLHDIPYPLKRTAYSTQSVHVKIQDKDAKESPQNYLMAYAKHSRHMTTTPIAFSINSLAPTPLLLPPRVTTKDVGCLFSSAYARLRISARNAYGR